MSTQIISELNKRNFAAKANTSEQRHGVLWDTEEEEVENRRLLRWWNSAAILKRLNKKLYK